MIWTHLRKSYLHEAIGDKLLDRLSVIIPVLRGDKEETIDLYTKASLCKIFSAFAPMRLFRGKEFMQEFLNSLPPDDLENLCKATGVESPERNFESRGKALLQKGWRDQKFCKAFLTWAGLPEHFLPPRPTQTESESLLDVPSTPFKTLKDFQFPVYSEASSRLETNLARFVIQMPTGSGKTRTAMEFITQFFNSAPEGCVVFWLAHSEELCEQSLQCFLDVWMHVAQKELRVIRHWGAAGTLPYAFRESAFIVAGFQKLHALLTRNPVPFRELRDRVELIIVDEAHRVVAPTYKQVTKALVGRRTRLVGLTATPGRGVADDDGNRALSAFFFGNILSIQTPPDQSVIAMLRDRGVLSQILAQPLVTNITYELTKRERTYLDTHHEFSPQLLGRIADDDVRNLQIVRRLRSECEKGGSILFFACSVEQSRFMCSLLLYLGYQAAHIDGSTAKPLRKNHIDSFKAKRIQVLCNYGVLSTGFDAPKTDVIFIARPTTSIVLYSQMIGRGLRGPAIGGTESCRLIDVRDNILGVDEYDYIYTYFEDYWSEE